MHGGLGRGPAHGLARRRRLPVRRGGRRMRAAAASCRLPVLKCCGKLARDNNNRRARQPVFMALTNAKYGI